MTDTGTAGSRRRTGPLAGVLAFQAAVLVAAGAYLAAGNPLAPDHGLQQLDMITLDEPVEGLGNLDGVPTLVLVPGDLSDRRCATLLRRMLQARGTDEGLPDQFGLAVAAHARPAVPLDDAAFLPDPDGDLARALALPDAAGSCRPGYALVDSAGNVRYRTYDEGYPDHALEQVVLLEHLREKP